jgi:hypothetical protein
LPAGGSSSGRMKVFDMAQVARIVVDCIGQDFDPYISRLESEARQRGVAVFQVWLPLASPFVSAATDILRRRRYFLGGMVPYFRDGDGLPMQKVRNEPDRESVAFYSHRASRIGEMIKRDGKVVTS